MLLSVANAIATTLVTSRLAYCNSFFQNIALKVIIKLLVQNCLARVVAWSPWFSCSVALLISLNWLPIPYRIIFKICTIAYQAFACKQPSHLHALLTPVRKFVQLRSSSSDLLLVPVRIFTKWQKVRRMKRRKRISPMILSTIIGCVWTNRCQLADSGRCRGMA